MRKHFTIFSLGANLDLSNCWLLYREVTLNLTPLAAKLTAKYYVSFDFGPVAMEISTRYLAHSTPAVMVGWNQLRPVRTSLI